MRRGDYRNHGHAISVAVWSTARRGVHGANWYSNHHDVCAKSHGISHNKIEDTLEEHIQASVVAFDALADKIIKWIVAAK